MTLYGGLAEHIEQRDGKEVYVGSAPLDGAGELAVNPGFAIIDAVLVQVEKATVPTTDHLSWSVAAGVVTIHGWDAGVASAAEETVSYVIIGRRR